MLSQLHPFRSKSVYVRGPTGSEQGDIVRTETHNISGQHIRVTQEMVYIEMMLKVVNNENFKSENRENRSKDGKTRRKKNYHCKKTFVETDLMVSLP